jgi:tRNA-dependent cyclodipeptide synthase
MNVSNKKKIQYPPQTGPYKVCVKDKNTWSDHHTARLQISLGNPKQDGIKMLTLTQWAAARFDKVIFIVSDTLQRHNLALRHGISLADAHDLALTQGHEWMARNKDAINSVPNRVVTVWDEWLARPAFAATRQEIDAVYDSNAAFKEAVVAKARQFSSRHDPQYGEAALETSIEYILEEMAAFGIMFKETQAADFYAGTWLREIFSVLAPLPLPELLNGFAKVDFAEVDFARNGNSISSPPGDNNNRVE